MTVQRLREVLTRLRAQLDESDAEQKLKNLENALQQQVNQPTQPTFQDRVWANLEELRTAMRDVQQESTATFWYEAISEIGLENMLPYSIFASARSIIETANMVPAVALGKIRELRSSVEEARSKISGVIDGVGWLNFAETTVPEEKAEIGILVPRAAVDNNLDRFGDELHDLNTLLNAIAQAVTGGAEDIKIESISSSEFLVFVWLGPKIVKGFAEALREILAVYKDYLEIQDIRQTLALKKAFTKKALETITKESDRNIGKRVNAIVEDILSKSTADEPTKNDLRNRLRSALHGMMTRLTKGYLFDVRASHESESSDDEDVRETAKQINEIARVIERNSIPSEKLLELPPAEDHPADDEPEGDE